MTSAANPAAAQAARFRRWLAAQIATLSWGMELEHLPVPELAKKLGVSEEVVRHAARIRARSRRKGLSGDHLTTLRICLSPDLMGIVSRVAEARRTSVNLLLGSIMHHGCKQPHHPKLEHRAIELPRLGLVRVLQEGQSARAACSITRALSAALKTRSQRANVSVDDYARSLLGDYFMGRLKFETMLWSPREMHGDVRLYDLLTPPEDHATDDTNLAGHTLRRRDRK